jgi:N-carbamoyl-L-amino-acid hydrolase
MLGSGVMAGKIDLTDAYELVDRDGRSVRDELERIGYRGEMRCEPRPMRAYLELHIEQGPLLEEAGIELGIVEGIVGISWTRITLEGIQDHAGPTPMRSRRDALLTAADIVRAVREIPRTVSRNMVGTVGALTTFPNIPNAIPGHVTMSVDLRDPRAENVERALELLDEAVQAAADREGTVATVEHYWRVPPTPFDPAVVHACERAANALGASYMRMHSGAGHDAQYMAAICPTAMIFVPSTQGRSHCEEEFTAMESVEMGANALLLAAAELAGEHELG